MTLQILKCLDYIDHPIGMSLESISSWSTAAIQKSSDVPGWSMSLFVVLHQNLQIDCVISDGCVHRKA